MAVTQASEPYTGATLSEPRGQTVVNLDSIFAGRVPMRAPENEKAPDGLFDWIHDLPQPAVFVTANTDPNAMTDWYNWLLDEHAHWFRETHPDDQLETPGTPVRAKVEGDNSESMVDFTPPVSGTAANVRSKDDSSADDGKVSAAAPEKTSDTGSTQTAARTVQRNDRTTR